MVIFLLEPLATERGEERGEFSMTTDGEGRGKITVLVRQIFGPPTRFRRPVAGLTLGEALDALFEDDGFPVFAGPVFINREEVDEEKESGRTLNPEDILSVNDP